MREYDGRTPVRYCSCGCLLVIGDGSWAAGVRRCGQLTRPLRRR